jgi:hypothetical protein
MPALRAHVRNATTNTAFNMTTIRAVPWDTEDADVGGWHSTSSNTSRLTVPSGYNISRVDLNAYLIINGTGNIANFANFHCQFRKNGTTTVGGAYKNNKQASSGVTDHAIQMSAFAVPCKAGDYFEVWVYCDDSGADLYVNSYFTIKAVYFEEQAMAPQVINAPIITGNAIYGNTLTVNTGDWTGTPTSYAYQWNNAGTPISGETANSYVIRIGDIGDLISCAVSATNHLDTTSTTTASVGPVIDSIALTSVAPKVAYSISRRIMSAYSGPLFRVRRSSDDAEQDIGFDVNGDVDLAALNAFVGANDGRIRTVYDQSGYARHLNQTGATLQPWVRTAGSNETVNSKLAIRFAGGQSLDTTGTGTAAQIIGATVSAYTHMGVIRATTAGSSTTPYQNPTAWQFGARMGLMIHNGPTIQTHHYTSDHTYAYVTSEALPYNAVAGARFNALRVQPFFNGVHGVNLWSTTLGGYTNTVPLEVGTNFGSFYTGYIAEFAIWDSSLSDADLNLIGTYFNQTAGRTWTTHEGNFDFEAEGWTRYQNATWNDGIITDPSAGQDYVGKTYDGLNVYVVKDQVAASTRHPFLATDLGIPAATNYTWNWLATNTAAFTFTGGQEYKYGDWSATDLGNTIRYTMKFVVPRSTMWTQLSPAHGTSGSNWAATTGSVEIADITLEPLTETGSNDFHTWTSSGGCGWTKNTARDNSTASFSAMSKSFATTNGVPHELSMTILKDGDTTRRIRMDAGANLVWFRTDTGATSFVTGFSSTGVEDLGTHWRLWGRWTTSATTISVAIYPAVGSVATQYVAAQQGKVTVTECSVTAV